MSHNVNKHHTKEAVQDFWQKASCGEELYLTEQTQEGYNAQAAARYSLEPYILNFAGFAETKGKKMLEIGVGLGAEHQSFAEAGAICHGIDLTHRAIENTQKRLKLFGLKSQLQQGDAENLPFEKNLFDHVYSWGVIHHSPNTPNAAAEILRVLKPGGTFRVMIYNTHSLIGYMLWLRYALLAGKPWKNLAWVYAHYLESPGTKAYTPKQAKALFAQASHVETHIELTHGDLLQGAAGQRHEGKLLNLARRVWPRWFFKTFMKNHGLFLLISGKK